MKKTILFISILFLSLNSLYAFEPKLERDSKNRKPDKVEQKVFSSVDEVIFDQSYGNIQVLENSTNEIKLEIRYYLGYYKEKNNATYVIPFCEIYQNGGKLKIQSVKTGKENSKIDYLISMPRKTNLSGNVKYGRIELNDFQGVFNMSLKYSKLNAGSFFNDVFIDGKYSDFSINNVTRLTLNADYSKLILKKGDELKITGKYSDHKITEAKNLILGSSYGDVNIQHVNSLSATFRYTKTNIGNLGESLKATCDYSDMIVKMVSSKVKMINVEGKYSDISLKIDPATSFDIEFNTKYGKVNVAAPIHKEYKISEKKNTSAYYKGIIGIGPSFAKMNITTSYGDINIK